MSTKFFNNTGENTLYNKLRGVAAGMAQFERFLAVAGYFRSSGYFKLREELGTVSEIKILVGINIDDIFRRHNAALPFSGDDEAAKRAFDASFKQDIIDARYAPEVERGILQMCDDLATGRLEMRIYSKHNLHAKFYLCLPQQHTEHSDGWVIMGSSNLSDAGLGITEPPRYELNVALRDYDDVHYCYEEFLRLWEDSVPLTLADIDRSKQGTYLGVLPTPYEIYMKVLINTFGEQVEDDFTMSLPEGVRDLKYQRDAVIQGYQIILKHRGVFLADVVGLGKTLIATMIAKRFIEENGRQTRVLVICPPSLLNNWRDTFRLFGIKENRNVQFVSNCSLDKIINATDQYHEMEEVDMVIVDEAHSFRNDDTGKYDRLQKICKAPCSNSGMLHLSQKRVLLLSATPLNNSPEDLLNQVLLFQDAHHSTIDGITYISRFFDEKIKQYKEIMKRRDAAEQQHNYVSPEEDTSDIQAIDTIYTEIRERVIDKVTIRRTRNNILNDTDYAADIAAQGITFPTVLPPQALTYRMSAATSERFFRTLDILSNEKYQGHLTYARYRAVEFLKAEYNKRNYPQNTGENLKHLFRTHMVKRLESSFHAFKISLETLLRITENMLKMYADNKVLIIPDINVNDLLEKGEEIDTIIAKVLEKDHVQESDICYPADAFESAFYDMLVKDQHILQELIKEWNQETGDPKFDTFAAEMEGDFFVDNPSQKLIIFSESVDTLDYLYHRLTADLRRHDVIEVTATTRKHKEKEIKENFDASHSVQNNKYNILLSSDVLAEGINLHRANVIVNYDTPWNATRLMQRIGRVNRIGTTAPIIRNFVFYPSKEGDREINLYQTALNKMQGFHSAYGEDSQIFSPEEIVRQFKIYSTNVRDNVDDRIMYLREVRELFVHNKALYNKIKCLPLKSRVTRENAAHRGRAVVFLQSPVKTEYFFGTATRLETIDFLTAAALLKASPDEQPLPFVDDDTHYAVVNKAVERYRTAAVQQQDTLFVAHPVLSKNEQKAYNFIANVQRHLSAADPEKCDQLLASLAAGRYKQLPKRVNKFLRDNHIEARGTIMTPENRTKIEAFLAEMIAEYGTPPVPLADDSLPLCAPQVIVTETFK